MINMLYDEILKMDEYTNTNLNSTVGLTLNNNENQRTNNETV